MKTFNTRIKLYSSEPFNITNHRLWYHLLRNLTGETQGRSNENETRAQPNKRMTPPSTQNLKALGLWVFFLICCSTFSFLLNVELRLTLGYLTSQHWAILLSRLIGNHHKFKKEDKLVSFKKMYFHKLNFYLNQTTNQAFIIHLIHHIISNTSHSCDTHMI